jgi:transposase InsO family protein
MVTALVTGSGDYFQLYNFDRPHQSLGHRTPADARFAVGVPIL